MEHEKIDEYNELLIKYNKLSYKHRMLCEDYISLIKQLNNLAKIMELNLDGGTNEIIK